MAIPEKFSGTELLQDTARRLYNKRIRLWFKDLETETEPDLNNNRSALKYALTHREQDTIAETNLRAMLFSILLEATHNRVVVNGVEFAGLQRERKFLPQIFLYFLEDRDDVDEGYEAIDGRITFRLVNHGENITPAEAQALALKIKSEFANGGGYHWHKGKGMYSYTDKPNGVQLQLLCFDKTQARELVGKVLDIQGRTPDWAKFNSNVNEEPGQAFPTVPENHRVYNKTYRKPRRRPVGYVRFQYALLNLWGMPNPVPLVDRSGYFPQAIEVL